MSVINLFTVAEMPTEEYFFEIFKTKIDKLKNEGFSSLDIDWWRSRYYETVICPGHQRHNKGFEHEQLAHKAWTYIWKNYRSYMTSFNSKSHKKK